MKQNRTSGGAPSKEVVDVCLGRLKEGDISALEPLYDVTHRQLYALCFGYFGNREDSEDALSDTYLKVRQEIGKYRGQSGYAWMYTIAKNICLNMLKRSKRVVTVDYDDEETVNKLELWEENGTPTLEDESGVIAIARQVLSEHEFRVVVLHAVSGCKFKEIGAMTGVPEVTVRWQYNNALKKIRKECERREKQ